jgi:uncharacterized protein (TIGR02757 family)
LVNFNLKRHRHLFSGIKYRFNDNNDIVRLLHTMSMAMKQYGSIEALFKLHFKGNDLNVGSGLTGLIDTMISIGGNQQSAPLGRDFLTGSGFLQFFPSPAKGSACKRMNLFLRWMIRDRDIDFGIWKGIQKNKLVIPLDTHIARISKCLGFTKRSFQGWKMAMEITEALKRLDSKDPLKYDFALCHQGISKICSRMNCRECSLFSISESFRPLS